MSTRTDGLDFLVNRADWHDHRFVEAGPPPDPEPGQVLFRVDRFAFTANNISYAAAGDMLGYWRFFPAGEEGWGRIPAMGYGDVIASRHPDVAEGTRCFGFYPMSRYLTIQPGKVNARQIVDAAPHREGLAPVYAEYAPVASDPSWAPEHEDATMLMRGLFMTSFLAEDFLRDDDLFGARSVLITSASSKTSIALGFLVKQIGQAKAIGLTSARNRAFVESLGFYDEVVLYEDAASLAKEPVVLVDMAGDADVMSALHHHYGDDLKYSCRIGATHWESGALPDNLPGAKPEFFFAPAQIVKRAKDWGPEGLQQRLGESWVAFRDASTAWLSVKRGYGQKAVVRVFEDTLDGRSSPSDGHVISLWDSEEGAIGR